MTGRCKSRGRLPSLQSLRRSKKSPALQPRHDEAPPKPYATAPTLLRGHKPVRTKTSRRGPEARRRKDTRRGRARYRKPHTPLSPIKEGEEKHPFGRRGTESTRSPSSSIDGAYAGGFRPDYELGDTLRSPHHMLAPSAREARHAADALQNHDYAFIRRSDGSYTYAVLAYRSYEADVAAECLHFVIDDSGATKMIPLQWGTCVLLVSDEGVDEECLEGGDDSVEQEASEQCSAEPNKLLNSPPRPHRGDEANSPSREENERAAAWPCVVCAQEFVSYTELAEHACQSLEDATSMECDDDADDGTDSSDGSDCSDDMTFSSARSMLSEHVIEAEPLVANDACVEGTDLQTPPRPRRRVSDVSVHSPFYGEDVARQIEAMAAKAEGAFERRRSIRSAEGERELAKEHSNRAEEDVRASNEEELGFDVSQSEDAVTDIDQSFVFGDMPAIPSLQEASTKEATDSALAWSALGMILGSPAPTSAKKKRMRRPVLWQEEDGSACDDLERVMLPSDDDELGMGEKRMNPMCRTSSMPDLVLDESANDDCSIPSM